MFNHLYLNSICEIIIKHVLNVEMMNSWIARHDNLIIGWLAALVAEAEAEADARANPSRRLQLRLKL